MNLLLAAAEVEPGVWENLTKTFGLKLPFFVAQVINFFLVIFVLKKFAFGPIQTMLEERKTRIADGEEKLKQIEQQLADSEKHTAEAIAQANADAQRMIDEARESASKLSEQEAQKAIASAKSILAKAEEAAKAERAQMVNELKAEFGKLVTTATSQVAGKVLTDDDQRRINEESMATLPN
ncbi:F0F1 ATP synthase subunit B [Roseibacillus persicicus]|uniref:ATP synthase subunit b n=1 Tax=Roseibacillus persicicus TaxID=454148 RepID=A0A918TP43_9BACT|nr:F0F1 ATP synthase subunit B [Roseibacillus persicicus]MDQ8191348.1 F0F1 ATP synthase subunit B [Roseibacillus persicicus]GHC54799.1 ATP synthase subunit b [Roseibacillus persicicus]